MTGLYKTPYIYCIYIYIYMYVYVYLRLEYHTYIYNGAYFLFMFKLVQHINGKVTPCSLDANDEFYVQWSFVGYITNYHTETCQEIKFTIAYVVLWPLTCNWCWFCCRRTHPATRTKVLWELDCQNKIEHVLNKFFSNGYLFCFI